METPVVDIMDLTKVANTFPKLGDNSVRRENMLVTLEEMFHSDSEVITIEGPDGIGKTTLLAQFGQRYPDQTFCLFIRSSSRFAYDSCMLARDLCDQIGWVLRKEHYRTSRDLDPGPLLRAHIYDLQRLSNSEHKTFYFVVDGLSEIPEVDCREQEMILNLLPFGLPRFHFLLSGPLPCLKTRPQKISGLNTFRLPGFTFEETCQFLSDLVKDRGALETIHKVSKMVPGNLASVRRLLLSGVKVNELLSELPDRLPDLFELEWRAVEKDDTLLRQVLGILAFDRRRHSLADLARICKTEPSSLDQRLSCCNFIERKNNNQEIDFVCDVFCRFAADRLSSLRTKVLEMVITDLLSEPESVDALTHLPGILHQAGRFEELLKYLSPEHIGNLINYGDSWVPLHQKADLGVDTALHLKRDGDLMRFGLQMATIASLESSESWRSEVEAYVALNDFAAAYALVQRMITREDRLHLLAVIARAKKSMSLTIEVELSDQIRQLYGMLDRPSLGKRGVEIASDLLHTHPELAIELIQECTAKEGAENRVDLALARLSFKTLIEREEGVDGMQTTQRALRAKVKDPQVQRFMDTTYLFFGGFSAQGVISEVEKWEKAADRIFALRAWTVTNATRNDAAVVIEYALTTILKTTSYAANARVYQELALPLVYIPDVEQMKTIISRLDGLKGPIESAGPTAEYVKLQATLAEAEARYSMQASFNRLQDLFFYADSLPELDTKLTSLAVLAGILKKIDKAKSFTAMGPIHELVIDSLKTVVDEILVKTAEHYEAISPAIDALARSDTKIALEVVSKLNTAPRREAGLIKFVEAVAEEAPNDETFEALREAYKRIESIPMRAKATLLALRALMTHRKSLGSYVNDLINLQQWVMNIPGAEDKCQGIWMVLEMLLEHKSIVSPGVVDLLTRELGKSWEEIDDGWAKVNAGFKIVTVLAKCSPEVSRQFIVKTEKARNEIVLDCYDSAMSYIGCVRLVVRCFAGLIKRRVYREEDLISIADLINKIPSVGVQLYVWGELALKFFVAGDPKHCQDIVSTRIRPILESDIIRDTEARQQVIVFLAAPLHCAHHASAKQLIGEMPQPYRDDAYSEICSFLITKHLPTENYDHESKPAVKMSYEEIVDLCEILECLEADHTAYWLIETFVSGICKHFRGEFNVHQIADVVQKLRNLANKKFPNPVYIKHEGYKILSEAQIARLDRDKVVWDDLAKRAKDIPNVADKVFVLIGIAGAMPAKEREKAIELLLEAKALIPQIAIYEDRYSRYKNLAEVSADIDKQLSKNCLKQAWHETLPFDPDKLPDARRRLIDFAYRLDPEFAANLASETDSDPGREFARKQTEQRIDVLRLRERMTESIEDLEPAYNVEQQVEVAQMMLVSLNSNRSGSVQFGLTRPFIKQASRMNLENAYVVLCWVIENAVRRHADTDQASVVISNWLYIF